MFAVLAVWVCRYLLLTCSIHFVALRHVSFICPALHAVTQSSASAHAEEVTQASQIDNNMTIIGVYQHYSL